MFIDIFGALCEKKNVSRHAAAKACGLSNSTTTKWKKTRATPESATLVKLADYFNVSVDFLLGATPESYLLGTEYALKEAEKEYDKESDPDKRDQLGAYIDGLRDSLEDLRLAERLNAQKPAAENGSGGDIVGAEDEVVAKKERIIRMLDNVDPSDYDRAIAILELLQPRQDSQAGSHLKDG